ncbi:MAG: hypothetical protein KY455_04845 [Euryarchaeota archaeon]|nr:hypothetical protein [Euryarchaeota archaeon]
MITGRDIKIAGFSEDKETVAAVERARAMFALRERIHTVVAATRTVPQRRRRVKGADGVRWPSYRGLDDLRLGK